MQMKTTTRLAFVLTGAGLALTGTILMLRAGWGFIAVALSPIWASAILGGALVLTGLILALLARASHKPAPRVSPQAAMMGAFFEGLQAGRATRKRAH